MTEQPPVILLNIDTEIKILEGLVLYVLASGNDHSVRIDNHDSCFKFYVFTTNTTNGEKVKMKFALHGRLGTRKGVGIDNRFVVEQIVKALKDYLSSQNCIITDNLPMGPTMVRAIWRHTFNAGSRVADFANGVGVFSQPAATSFNIGTNPITELLEARGKYTLAIANEHMVKFYLGEESPVWGYEHESEGEAWHPIRKRVTPTIVNACLDHFLTRISRDNNDLQVFPNDKFEELLQFVAEKVAGLALSNAEPVVLTPMPVEDDSHDSEDRPGFVARMRSFIGMGT